MNAKLTTEDARRMTARQAFTYRVRLKELNEVSEALEEKACEDPKWAYELRRTIPDISEKIKKKAELKACEDPLISYYLLRDIVDLPEEVRRKAELMVCDNYYWAFYLRRDIVGLPDEIKRRAELTSCKNPILLEGLLTLSDLHPDTVRILDLVHLGFPPAAALQILEKEKT